MKAQSVFTNDDGLIHIDSNAIIYVEGDVLIENTGVISNSGTIYVQNDWINNSNFNVFLNSKPGLVEMIGFNQSIGGVNPTRFYNLSTLNASVKTIQVDTWVENKLDITDAEIALNTNKLHLFNPHPDSLMWNTGFISGDSIGGYFLRSTNRSQPYLYPVGDASLLGVYRAVSFIPSNGDSSVFGVRLAATNADIDATGVSFTGAMGPFPFNQADPEALEINSNFYHHIARFYGTSNGQAKVYYFNTDEPLDNDYNSLVLWNQGVPRWETTDFTPQIPSVLASIGSPDKNMVSSSLDFSNEIYALTIKDKNEVFVPQIFSPNGDGVNDILYPYGNRYETLTFTIYNRWGEKVFESTRSTDGWDGKFRGIDAQPGVYVYYLEGVIKEKGRITQKGDITLVR